MKPVQSLVGPALQRIDNPTHDLGAQIAQLEQLGTELVKRLKASKPAWHRALPTTAAVVDWKREMLTAMAANGVTTEAQIERALMAAAADPSPWFPAVGQMIAWAKAPVGVDEAFERMIAQAPGRNPVERATFRECGYACRTQLAADRARAVFAECFAKWAARAERGELIETPALPASSSIEKMHNGNAVARAGEIPAGKGKAHYDAMRARLGRATARHKTGGRE